MSRTASDPERTSDDLQDIFGRYQGHRGDLIPLLQDIQARLGYISAGSMQETARFLNVPRSIVYGVVTFYAQFYLTPQGRHKIKVCLGTACHVRHGSAIMEALERKLGISAGGTTDDLKFTLERVACFGSCALGPVMVVNDKVHGKMTPGGALKLVEALE